MSEATFKAWLRRVMEPEPWTHRAACLGKPMEWFFVENVSGTITPNARKGIAVCFRCPVRAECLEYALRNDEEGIWGGSLYQDRAGNPPALRDALMASTEERARAMGVIA